MDRVIFTLCKHCHGAISLNPREFIGHEPNWDGPRYWCHFHVVADEHLPEPMRPFLDHLIRIA